MELFLSTAAVLAVAFTSSAVDRRDRPSRVVGRLGLPHSIACWF
jgi:hypothetical protein